MAPPGRSIALDEPGLQFHAAGAYPSVVTYTAGWLLPGDDGRNLPPVIESGCMSLISTSRAGRGRDPLAKSRNHPRRDLDRILGRPGRRRLGAGASGMPPDIDSRLSIYRRRTV